MIVGAQIRAARAMLRWSPHQLAARSKLPVETIRRAEQADDDTAIRIAHEQAIRGALEGAGITFLDDDGSGPGLRVRMPSGPADEGLRPDQLTSQNDG